MNFARITKKQVLNVLKNKYFITFIIFLIWLLFFDRNNIVEIAKNMKHLKQLEKDKQYYIERIENDSERLKQLRTNNENLEKFARETYFMKKHNEDLFIVVEEDK